MRCAVVNIDYEETERSDFSYAKTVFFYSLGSHKGFICKGRRIEFGIAFIFSKRFAVFQTREGAL